MVYLLLGCRCLLGLVFAASVTSKLRGRAPYAEFTLAAQRLAPGWVTARVPAEVLAAVVAAAEAAVVVLLAGPGTVRWGLVVAGVLAMGFAVAVTAALRRGDRAPCRCFGASDRPIGQVHLVRNGLLAATACLGLVADQADGGPLQPAGAVAAVVAGAVAAMLVVTADDVAELFGPHAPTR